jgi:hypothetical protein
MGTTNFDKVKADEADVAVVKVGGVQVTTTPAQLNVAAIDPGQQAVAVVDFNTGAAEAGCKVTIGGVDYLEQNAENLPGGVWTNGASAADSATSFAAAVNGDTRAAGGKFSAVRSAAGESVIITAKAAGVAGNAVITTDSPARVTVETPARGGRAAAVRQLVGVRLAVTAQDILADEVNVPLPGAPVAWGVDYFDATGAVKANTWLATAQTAPHRIRVAKNGATHLIATDIIAVWAIV